MALILCIVAVNMKAEATLIFAIIILREMAPMLSVFAVNITASQALTAVNILPMI